MCVIVCVGCVLESSRRRVDREGEKERRQNTEERKRGIKSEGKRVNREQRERERKQTVGKKQRERRKKEKKK